MKAFAIYRHAVANQKKRGGGGFFPAFGALAKINVFPFVTCADLKRSKKKCGILMIER